MLEGVAGPSYHLSSGVPQGSVLGPYLFAAYMGSLFPHSNVDRKIDPKIVLYADDLTIIETVTDIPASSVSDIVSRINEAGLSINQRKCTKLCIVRVSSHVCDGIGLFPTDTHAKVLGFILNNKLTWHDQISSVLQRASKRLYAIRVLKKILSTDDLKIVYHALITSLIMYASPVYGHLSTGLMSKLERFQRRAHRLICGEHCPCNDFKAVDSLFNDAAINFLSKCEVQEKHPLHLYVPPRMTRTQHLVLPSCRTEKRLRTFFPFACMLANGILKKWFCAPSSHFVWVFLHAVSQRSTITISSNIRLTYLLTYLL